MKVRIQPKMSNAEIKTYDRPIRERIAHHIDAYAVHLEATYLWYRHVADGHGKKRLMRDLKEFGAFMEELKSFYELEDSDGVEYVCLKGLKDIGFDVSLLGRTFDVEYSINGRKRETK